MKKFFISRSSFFKCIITVLLTALLSACASKVPYAGPVMSQKSIRQTFDPILQFMNYQPGMAFADVGAGEGAITVMMTTMMNGSAIYIQDIDQKILNQENMDKMIDYYSRQSHQELRKKNQYNIAYGDANHSNLPDHSLDLIYSNATIHVFSSPDSMIADLRTKLKPTGTIFIRDDFKNHNGKGERCGDSSCPGRLITVEEFLMIMKTNGFKLLKQTPDMSGSPLFGFALEE